MIANRSDVARLQSDFYRDQFRKMVRWLIYSMVIMMLLVAAIVYCIIFQPTQQFYANTAEGRILTMPVPRQ